MVVPKSFKDYKVVPRSTQVDVGKLAMRKQHDMDTATVENLRNIDLSSYHIFLHNPDQQIILTNQITGDNNFIGIDLYFILLDQNNAIYKLSQLSKQILQQDLNLVVKPYDPTSKFPYPPKSFHQNDVFLRFEANDPYFQNVKTLNTLRFYDNEESYKSYDQASRSVVNSLVFDITVSTRDCIMGEIKLAKNKCLKCREGKYSLNPNL